MVLRLAYPHQHPIRSFLFSLPRLSKYADSFNFLLAADQTESARRAEDRVRGVGRARLSKYEPLVFSQNISALKRCLSLNAERRRFWQASVFMQAIKAPHSVSTLF